MARSIIIALILFAVAGVAFYFVWQRIQEKQKTEGWKEHQGRVRRIVDMRKQVDEYEKWVNVTFYYEYVVDGRVYTETATNRENVSKKRHAKKKYQPGAPVKIYFNPENPAQSSLTSGVSNIDYILLIIPGIFLLIGFSFL